MGFYWKFICSIFQTVSLNLSIKTLICLASILIFAQKSKICEAVVAHYKTAEIPITIASEFNSELFSCWTTNNDALDWAWHKINAILHFRYRDLSVLIMAVFFHCMKSTVATLCGQIQSLFSNKKYMAILCGICDIGLHIISIHLLKHNLIDFSWAMTVDALPDIY